MRSRDVDHQHLVQLATRIPRGVARRVKEFCVRNDLRMQTFVGTALAERLVSARQRRPGAARSYSGT